MGPGGTLQLPGPGDHPPFQRFVERLQFDFGPLPLGDAPLQRFGHLIKGAGQLQQFALAVRQAGAHLQITFAQTLRCSHQRADLAEKENISAIPGGHQRQAGGATEQQEVAHEGLPGLRVRDRQRQPHCDQRRIHFYFPA